MHVEMHAAQRISTVAFNVRQWFGSLEEKVAHLSRTIGVDRLSVQEVRDAIYALTIVMGAAACGLRWNSFGAALFAGVALFFLAGIHRAMKRVVAAVSRSERERSEIEDIKRDIHLSKPGKSEGAEWAIDWLRPWVAGETSLTEEEAKSCCAALLDTGGFDPEYAEIAELSGPRGHHVPNTSARLRQGQCL